MKYGTLKLIDWTPPQTAKQFNQGVEPKPRRVWEVDCEPHVSLQLKRLFPALADQFGKYRLSNTPDVCRNLAWFMLRFPMKVTPADTLYGNSAKHKEREERIFNLTKSKVVSGQPTALLEPLRNYQELAGEIGYLRNGLMLCDDTGVGKTATGIGLMVRCGGITVVVVPTNLPLQWKQQIARFRGQGITTHIITKGQPYDLTRVRSGRGRKPVSPGKLPDVIIISYSKLAGWAEVLAQIVTLLIFEEMQELRKDDSDKAAAARHLRTGATWCMGLSATPFYNYGGEFFNVADVISPGELGTREEFHATWCDGSGDKVKIKDPVAFHSFLKSSGLMLRRTRKDVGRELPPTSKIPHYCEVDSEAFDLMSAECEELAKNILRTGEEYRGQKMQANGEFDMRMRQATGIAKAPYVAEFVKMLLESEQSVVLYGWHRDVYKIWLDKLKEFNPVLYTGTESPAEKDYSKGKFVRGESRVLVISLRSGVGLDGLQFVTRTVVLGELDWSSGVIKQCIERVDRDGQTDPVMAYYMLSDHEESSDPFMANALGVKTQQIEGVRDGVANFIEEMETDSGHIRRMAEAYLRRKA